MFVPNVTTVTVPCTPAYDIDAARKTPSRSGTKTTAGHAAGNSGLRSMTRIKLKKLISGYHLVRLHSPASSKSSDSQSFKFIAIPVAP